MTTISQLISLGILTLLLASCSEEKAMEQKKITNLHTSEVAGNYETSLSYKLFVNPPNKFRSYPFYSINGKLEPNELKRQISDFKEAGFGGFYLHSRVGLLTEFLSDDWWQSMDAAVEAAEEIGIESWFYDEDKWPSGFAGGIMPEMSEDYRAKSLVRLDKQTTLPKGCEILKEDSKYRYVCHTAQLGQAIFNGTSYVDLMNPEMVKSFIEVTHKPYTDRYQAKLPYTFGIFSDEPHIHARYFDKNTPNEGIRSYSPFVRARFKNKFNYDLFSKVDLLFEEREDWRKVRLQFHQAVAEQFEMSFSKQIGDFSEKNNTKFTGHYLGEDVLKKVRDRIGNSMIQYRHMHQPGMDNLGLTVANRIITARSVSSVANQYGIPKRLSELFGISGQNMNFEDRKWIANWHIMNGINHLCPHLTLFSMVGERKRDYPPTFSYHQPYWSYNKSVEDYMARISYAATIGEYAPQILVINPLESEYIRGDDEPQFTKELLTLLDKLQESHYDYDLGDEQILADIASSHKGVLNVGAMAYKMVFLPDMIEMRKTTLDLLIEFASEGGIVAHYGSRLPEFLDGRSGSETLQILTSICTKYNDENFKSQLHNQLPATVTIGGKDASQVWSSVRKVENGAIIQLSNISHTEGAQFTISSTLLKTTPVMWDPTTAKCYAVVPNTDSSYTFSLAESSNIWLTTGVLSDSAEIYKDYTQPIKYNSIATLDKRWKGNRLDPNAITLDFASYSLDNGESWSESEPVIGIKERLSRDKYNGPLLLNYRVDVKKTPSKINLVVEQPEIYEKISVNNRSVTFASDNDFYIDHKFKSTSVAKQIKEGTNKLQLAVYYRSEQPLSSNQTDRIGTEIESIYLTGDFAVTSKNHHTDNDTQRNRTNVVVKHPVYIFKEFTIDKEDTELKGNLTLEGYPFYAGTFELQQTFNLIKKKDASHYAIRFTELESIVTMVELNGKTYAPITCAPFMVDVTNALKVGDNTIKLTFINSLRNLMGPHHNIWGEMTKVGPSSFSGTGGFPNGRGDSNWFDLRLKNDPLKIWRDHYYHIPFGLIKPIELCISESN